jgi:predicted nuclease of predicted toxin-antitoxin system
MKLLFDQNLSFKLCQQLADLFADSSQARLQGLAEADDRDDRTIWQHAKANGFTLVSQDADFAEMAALLGAPPKVIWLRGGNQPTAAIANLLRGRADIIAAFEHDDTAACLEIY